MSPRRPTRETTPALPPIVRSGGAPLTSSARAVLATASHEIRAPLHTILGMSELLTRTTLTPAQAQYLDALRRAATSLTSLLDSLLDAPRPREAAVRHERVWLPDVVEAAVATVRARADAAGTTLVVDVDNSVPRRVLGDAVRLQQIVINLLVNAVKYGEGGTVTLRVGADSDVAASTGVDAFVFAIEDTGPGIPAARLEEIFVAGQRLDRHTNIEGSGLGLAITRRIVDDLGGRLEVESRFVDELGPGQSSGTVFRVRLPLAHARSMQTVDGSALAIRGVRFLVVGDPAICAAVRSALSPWSPLIECVDVDSVVARWRAQRDGSTPFHVLIVGGEHLHAVAGVADGRVIAVLSSAALNERGAAIEHVAATPILLPVTTGNLFGAVERVLRRVHNLDTNARDIDLTGAVVHAADDDDDARLLIELFVKDTGVTLHLHATTAALVNAVVADPATTLVLCDVEMPDGGARVARAAIPVRQDVSFVAVTAHGEGVVNDLYDEGFLEVARKPLTRRGLIDVIARRGVPRRRHTPATSPALVAKTLLMTPLADDGPPAPTPAPQTTTPTKPTTRKIATTMTMTAAAPLDDGLQLEARMALARRDYRALMLLGRRLLPPFREQLETAARARNDAAVREILRELEHGAPALSAVDEAIRALLPDYLERRRADAADIGDAIGSGRFDHVAFVGHRLAGTARAFGMEQLGEVGSALERAGQRRDGDEARALLQRMHQLLNEVVL